MGQRATRRFPVIDARREASCSCGALRVVATGEPVRVAVCHCFVCQRRTGSVFGVQARYARRQLSKSGISETWVRVGDEGTTLVHHFCPVCGSTVFYSAGAWPDHVVVPVGAFADPGFPAPTTSVHEKRRHPWVELPNGSMTSPDCVSGNRRLLHQTERTT